MSDFIYRWTNIQDLKTFVEKSLEGIQEWEPVVVTCKNKENTVSIVFSLIPCIFSLYYYCNCKYNILYPVYITQASVRFQLIH